jgi:hypothetical protein
MIPFKQCKCGTFCATGYCSECRAKDSTARTIKAREKMDREAMKKNGRTKDNGSGG